MECGKDSICREEIVGIGQEPRSSYEHDTPWKWTVVDELLYKSSLFFSPLGSISRTKQREHNTAYKANGVVVTGRVK